MVVSIRASLFSLHIARHLDIHLALASGFESGNGWSNNFAPKEEWQMHLVWKVLAVKGVLALIPAIGLMVTAQDCNQGLASAALALGVLSVLILP
jgi:hypothetical protein